MTHAVVLAVAVTISGYASVDRHFPIALTARLGAVNAEALVIGQGGRVGDVSLGRFTTIIKPLAIPTSSIVSHKPTAYTVQDGESLADLATRYHVSVSQIRWSNSTLTTTETVNKGDQITIPPVAGIVITAKAGDTIDGLASTYKSDSGAIADYNRLRTPTFATDTVIVIPDGTGPDFPPPPVVNTYRPAGGVSSFQATVTPCCTGSYTPNGFSWGWCTYYVATKRNVFWRGDAGYWYDNARSAGASVGSSPAAGAIMVTWESWAGHVAYVESVNGDGSWVVSEMNYAGFGVISQRTIRPGQLGSRLVGFIY